MFPEHPDDADPDFQVEPWGPCGPDLTHDEVCPPNTGDWVTALCLVIAFTAALGIATIWLIE